MIYAIVSALLMLLAAPPLNWYWFGWIGLIPFIYYLGKHQGLKNAFIAGYLFGIIYLGYLFWGVNELVNYAGVWGFLGYACLVLYYAFFSALFAMLISRVSDRTYFFVYIAAGWVLMEYLRSLGPFGATLGSVGYLESHFTGYIQLASIGGVYLLTFILVLVNAWIAQSLRLKNCRKSMLLMGILLLVCLAFSVFQFNLPIESLTPGPIGVKTNGSVEPANSNQFRLMLVQPNINQHDKLDGSKSWDILRYQEKLTLTSKPKTVEAIIWPETAVLEYIFGGSAYYSELKVFINLLGTNFVTGAPYWDGKSAFNSAFSFNVSGDVCSRYDKERLVPFGEYLLFRPLFYPLLGGGGLFSQDFSFGSVNPTLLKIGKAQAATAICFESVYPENVRRRVNLGGDFILVITNDAWFGSSSVAEQHLNIGIIRAVENGRYLAQCGNTGYSAVISPKGILISKSQLGKAQVIVEEIVLLNNRTIYGWAGDWIVWLCGLGFLIVFFPLLRSIPLLKRS